MSLEDWEKHNEGFRYEPPEGPPELWGPDEYEELYDRVISRHVRWECDKCSKPFGRLENARRHVQRQHGDRLIERAEQKKDSD